MIEEYVQSLCGAGFDLYESECRSSSESLRERQETAIAAEAERYDHRVKEMLCENRGFLEALARAIAEKGVLTAADVRDIRERCGAEKPAA